MNAARQISVLMVLLSVLLMNAAHVMADDTREEAVNSIMLAMEDIKEMSADGLAVQAATDLLIDANRSLERADFAELVKSNSTGTLAVQARQALEGLNYEGFSYAEVIKKAALVGEHKKQAYALVDSLKMLDEKIQRYKQQDVNVSNAETLLADSRDAFAKERYGEAETAITAANAELELKKSELTTLNLVLESSRTFLQRYWLGTSIVIILLVLLGVIVSRRIRVRRIRSNLVRLKTEEQALMELMKKNQINRFDDDSIPKSVYDLRAKKYADRLNEIRATIPVQQAMLEKATGKGKARKDAAVMLQPDAKRRKPQKSQKPRTPQTPKKTRKP